MGARLSGARPSYPHIGRDLVLEAFFAGLFHLFHLHIMGFLLLGVVIGLVVGALPGVGTVVSLVLILPFTFGMDQYSALALMLGLFATTTTGDTITSVLFGIPGSASAQASILDGFPMTKRGEAARALGAAFTVSMVGGVIGGLILAISLPIILPVILAFGVAEFFMLALLGLSMVGLIAGSSLLKGLGAALIGLLLAQIGYAEVSPLPRFTFDIPYLLDGLPLLPILLGLFGFPELVDLAASRNRIEKIDSKTDTSGLLRGVRDAFENWALVLRCSFIGVYVGIIPGLGASVVDWFAYGHTVQSAKDKSQFGKGDVRGLIGPEAANNAIRGGSLIPTLAFGVPGSVSGALLLTALLMQGLAPGREMLTENLDFTYSLVWMIILASILGSVILMLGTKYIASVVTVPGPMLVPGIVVFIFMGAWSSSTSLGDLIALFFGGFMGLAMKHAGWPRPPLVLAMVLGPIMEQQFQLSMRIYGADFIFRPVALTISLIVLATILFTVVTLTKNRRAQRTAAETSGEAVVSGEILARNPLISAGFTSLWLAAFVYAALQAAGWPTSVARFPIFVAYPAMAMFAAILAFDLRDLRRQYQAKAEGETLLGLAARGADLAATGRFLCWAVGLLALIVLIGQYLAFPVFTAAYLLSTGRKWWVALIYAATVLAMLHFIYSELMHIFWYRPLLAPLFGG